MKTENQYWAVMLADGLDLYRDVPALFKSKRMADEQTKHHNRWGKPAKTVRVQVSVIEQPQKPSCSAA